MLQGEHSAIVSTFIKLPFVIKIFLLTIFEWPLYTDFTLLIIRGIPYSKERAFIPVIDSIIRKLNESPQHKVSKGAKIRSRYNQVPHLTQDTNGEVTNSQLDTINKSQEVSPSTQLNSNLFANHIAFDNGYMKCGHKRQRKTNM